MGRVVVRFLLSVGVLAVCAQAWAGAPAQFEVVERFAARLSEGYMGYVQDVLWTEVVLTEHDLFVQVAAGAAARARLRDLINEGARLEVAFESASADGAVIVTREEMWLDEMPEYLLPLRSTGVYVVDGRRIHSITRVLDADQRDALMREAVVGAWRSGNFQFNYRAVGTFEWVEFNRLLDSADYTIEGGVVRIVSNERTVVCQPGDVGMWRASFTNADRFLGEMIEDMCEARVGSTLWVVRFPE